MSSRPPNVEINSSISKLWPAYNVNAVPPQAPTEGLFQQTQALALIVLPNPSLPLPHSSCFLAGDHGRNLIEDSRFRLTITYLLYKLSLMSAAPSLNDSFAALADPTRRAILARLASGEATVTELAKPFEMTQPAISQHLKVLEEAGLIVQRVDGAKRPRRLAKAGIDAMDQWLAILRKALEKNYDRLDAVLAAMEPNSKGKK